MSRLRSAKGFTLTELMVVVVILGLLATLVTPRVLDRLARARFEVAKTEILSISEAVKGFAMNNGRLPESLELLVVPDANGARYLDRETLPADPWRHGYWYEPAADGLDFVVGSYGADGEPGGEGLDADITTKTIANGRAADPR